MDSLDVDGWNGWKVFCERERPVTPHLTLCHAYVHTWVQTNRTDVIFENKNKRNKINGLLLLRGAIDMDSIL